MVTPTDNKVLIDESHVSSYPKETIFDGWYLKGNVIDLAKI